MKPRRALPLVLVSVATLLAFLAAFAIWADRQLLNTDNWTDTSSQLLQDEDIREQLSFFLVDELYANTDVQGRLEEALPPRAAPLAGPLSSGLRNGLQTGFERILERPRVQGIWEEANERAHKRFLQVVEGGGDVVSTEGGDVTLDLKVLLESGPGGLGDRVAERLPEDAAQLEVLKSDELELAQDILNSLHTLAWGLLVLALALYGVAIYLARGWRRKALRAAGFGFILVGALVLVLRSKLGPALADSLAGSDSVKPAVEATWFIGTSLLAEVASAALLYGLATVFITWLAGPTHLATSVRGGLAPYLREPAYAWGGFAVMALLLIAWSPTPAFGTLLGVVFILGLLALALQVIRRQTAREFPDASIEESAERWRQRVASIGDRFGGKGASGGDSELDALERLGKLRDSGVIDAAEFETEKARVLARA